MRPKCLLKHSLYRHLDDFTLTFLAIKTLRFDLQTEFLFTINVILLNLFVFFFSVFWWCQILTHLQLVHYEYCRSRVMYSWRTQITNFFTLQSKSIKLSVQSTPDVLPWYFNFHIKQRLWCISIVNDKYNMNSINSCILFNDKMINTRGIYEWMYLHFYKLNFILIYIYTFLTKKFLIVKRNHTF